MTDFKNMTCVELRKYIKQYETDTTGLSKCNKKLLIEWCEAIIPRHKLYKPVMFSYFAPSKIGD